MYNYCYINRRNERSDDENRRRRSVSVVGVLQRRLCRQEEKAAQLQSRIVGNGRSAVHAPVIRVGTVDIDDRRIRGGRLCGGMRTGLRRQRSEHAVRGRQRERSMCCVAKKDVQQRGTAAYCVPVLPAIANNVMLSGAFVVIYEMTFLKYPF